MDNVFSLGEQGGGGWRRLIREAANVLAGAFSGRLPASMPGHYCYMSSNLLL